MTNADFDLDDFLGRVQRDPALAVTVDVCDTDAGLVRQVIARGRAELLPFDTERGHRKLSRYLGSRPTTITATNLSYDI